MVISTFQVPRDIVPLTKPGEAEWAESLDVDDLQYMDDDGLYDTHCPSGCMVDPDGACYHGYSSPLVLLGMI